MKDKVIYDRTDRGMAARILGSIMILNQQAETVSDKAAILSAAEALYSINPDLARKAIMHVNNSI